jgi:L-ribulose-5-phosphate 3-epimerase
MAQGIADRLAVCSWSLHPDSPEQLIEKMRQIGLTRVNIALDPLNESAAWKGAKKKFADAGITFVGGMFGAVGEDYSTMDAIKATGGVVPDATWPKTWAKMPALIAIAQDLGLKYVMFHAGFLPHEPSDPSFEKLIGRVRQVADAWAKAGITLGMETGQEEADTLLAFFNHLGKSDVGINFDPANMILYDKDEPISALKKLAPYVKQCHVKDATRTTVKGQWGSEVVVGTGQVNWRGFFDTLQRSGFTGDLAIEREAGEQRVKDIVAAKEFVLKING